MSRFAALAAIAFLSSAGAIDSLAQPNSQSGIAPQILLVSCTPPETPPPQSGKPS